MCGICGVYNYQAKKNVEAKTIEEMCCQIEYRGPDEQGIYLGGQTGDGRYSVGLGHRRLAIIDLKTGQQPIYNEERTIVVVLNGEIYNFQKLRQDLEAKGHKFYTRTDTEVIVHLYEDYGKDCVKFLRGMFAFALWDEKKKKLMLARDRLGKKPLVYSLVDGNLVFASEIKSILAWGKNSPTISFEALHYFITYQYIPSPMTIFEQIKKLPPASILVCDQNGQIEISRYWDLDFRNKKNLEEKDFISLIREKLTDAVKIRLISDVPLGAFLSGGIDSSIIVGLMSQLSTQPVKTFTIGFKEEDYSEIKYARLVAQHFKCDHHEFMVEPNTIEILPKLIWHYNEPYADSSALPSYYVARETRRFVTVALNGDGGDENFAGYLRYRANMMAAKFNFLSGILGTKSVRTLIRNLPHQEKQKSLLRAFKRFALVLGEPPARRNISWHCIFDNNLKDRLYTEELKQKIGYLDTYEYMINVFDHARATDFVDKLLYTDIFTYLPEDLLVKMDIACMANSLEARSPFLDQEMMEFTATIPGELKLKGNQSKYILKKAFQDLLPPVILRRSKMGFGVPIEKWFRNELKNYVQEILLSPRTEQRGYFKKETIEELIKQHLSGKINHGYRLWSLLNLEIWHRIFIDGEKI